jgi:hypothetical protein
MREIAVLCGLVAGAFASVDGTWAQAFDPLADSFTRVQMDFEVPYLVTAPGSPDRSQAIATTDGGPTVLSFTADAPENFSIGTIEGFGNADFDRHRLRFDMAGPSARKATVVSMSHDVLTVAAPAGVPVGTEVTLTFVYFVTGSLFVELNRGVLTQRPATSPAALVRMSVTSYCEVGGIAEVASSKTLGNTLATFGELAARAEAEVILPLGPVPYVYQFDVPFAYGEPFGLNVSFQATAEPDRTGPTVQFSPYRELRGEGLIGDLHLDFMDTAALVAIVNEPHPDAVVMGRTFDYTHLVTDVVPVPVPEPGTYALMLAGLGLIGLAVRRRGTGTPT